MSPLIALQGSQIALLLGIGLFVFVLLRRTRRGFGETKRHGSTGSGRVAQLHAAAKEQESWEVEMHALARQLKGEIETKMRALERLIQMADEVRGELNRSIERVQSLGLLEDHDLATTSVERNAEEYTGVSAGKAESRCAKAQLRRGAVSAARLRLGENLGDDPRFERVYALADAGFSASRIASQIGSQVGEVELILSLRRSE